MFQALYQFIFRPIFLFLTYKIHIFEFTFCILDVLFFGFWCIMLSLIIKIIVNMGD